MSEMLTLRPFASVEDLIAQKRYREALQLANEELKRHPGEHRLLMLCADIYLRLNRSDQAESVLRHVAENAAATGSPAMAVAAIKKIEKIGRDDGTAAESLVTRMGRSRTQEMPLAMARFVLEDVDVDTPDLRSAEEFDIVDDAVPSPLFDDFSRDELLAFIKGLQLQIFDPGDIIVAQDDPGDSLFIVTSGIVKAFVRGTDRRHDHVRTLHDGDFFGEISILSGGRRSATVTAATHCELLELDRRALDSIIAMHPRVNEVMRRFYDERIESDRSLH